MVFNNGLVLSFHITFIRSFTVRTQSGYKHEWVIAVESPELEALRRSYGLSSKVKGYDFHITLGKQMPVAGSQEERECSIDTTYYEAEAVASVGNFTAVENQAALIIAQSCPNQGVLRLKSDAH